MNGCLVLDAGPGPVATRVSPAAGWPAAETVASPWDCLPAPALVLHRFIHAPAGCGEVVAQVAEPDLVTAGAAEPGDTAARLALLARARTVWPEAAHRLVFDTPFFADLPLAARLPALPLKLTAAHGLQRRGRHGPVHRHAAGAVGRVVSIYAGPDASGAAVAAGVALDTTAGVSASGGIPGQQTCGDVDPAVVLYLVQNLGLDLATVEQALGVDGGAAGLGEVGPEFQLRRVRRAVGALTATLGGVDRVVVSGPDAAVLAAGLASGLEYLGVCGRVALEVTPLTPATAAALSAWQADVSVSERV